MTKSRLPTILATALLAMAVVPLDAQTRESLPYEVVAALFGHGGELDVTVGELPDPMPFELSLPDDARVIASMRSRYGGGPLIAIALPVGRREAEDRMTAHLRAEGWTAPEFPRPRGGFVSSMETPTGFCRDRGYLHFDAMSGGGETVIRLQYNEHQGSPCSRDAVRTPWDDAPVPTLGMPAGAFSRGGGSSMGGGSIAFTTEVETRNSLESLITHFAAELTEQGWSGGPPVLGMDAGIQRWVLSGTSWRGYLTVVQLREGSYTAHFGMTDLEGMR